MPNVSMSVGKRLSAIRESKSFRLLSSLWKLYDPFDQQKNFKILHGIYENNKFAHFFEEMFNNKT